MNNKKPINCPSCNELYKGFGKVCRSCSKKGDINPAKNIEVRDRISRSVKEQYKIHKNSNLPYGFEKGQKNWMFGRSGEKNPKWKGGISNEERINKECFKQYGEKCFICGAHKKIIKHTNIYIHHLNHIHDDHRIENIIPVCDSCHQKLHRWWKGWTLEVLTDIDYGHHIPEHKGKCFYSHGHTAQIKLSVKGLLKEDGMVLDFKRLKEMIKNIVEPLDHSYLNTLIDNPTTELLASFIYHQIELELYKIRLKEKRIVWVDKLEISEGLGKSITIY